MKVIFGVCWKKEDFTLAEISNINSVKKDKKEFEETIKTMVKILSGDDVIIGYTLEWVYCRLNDGFFGNVDIMVDMYAITYENGKRTIRRNMATFKEINKICNRYDRNNCGFVEIYRNEE